MQYTVFLDTNSINSTSHSVLFGNHDKLKKLSGIATLVVPAIVLEELIGHKKKYFTSKLHELHQNPFFAAIGGSKESLRGLDFSIYETQLRKDQTVPYEVWSLPSPETFFDRLVDLAIRNEAPFDKGTDKGFKDACIAFTVEDYLNIHKEVDEAILITKDSRLIEFFRQSAKITAAESIDEAWTLCMERSAASFEAADKNHGSCSASNSASAAISTVSKTLISNLCESCSFQNTHNAVEALSPLREALTDNEKIEILRASATNQQIRWILSDEDIAEFIMPIFEKHNSDLTDSQYSSFVDAAGLPNNRLDEYGNILLSRSEQGAYQQFADSLMSHIQSVNYPLRVEEDADKLLCSFKSLLATANLDSKAVTWANVAAAILDNGATTSTAPIRISTLKSFIALLEKSSGPKRESIRRALTARLEEAPVDFGF